MTVDYPPLAALSRLFSAPPYSVAPDHAAISSRATLSVAPVLEDLFRLMQEDYRQLPLLAPVAVQYAGVALALGSHRFIPCVPPLRSLHQLHGLMVCRVLDNIERDPSFSDRSSEDHFRDAHRHLAALRGRLSLPASSLPELKALHQDLADLGVYLAFALHAATPRIDLSPPTTTTEALCGDPA